MNGIKAYKLTSWITRVFQGKSIKSLTNDKFGNDWIYNQMLLKPGRFITALKMRTNITANRAGVEH